MIEMKVTVTFDKKLDEVQNAGPAIIFLSTNNKELVKQYFAAGNSH